MKKTVALLIVCVLLTVTLASCGTRSRSMEKYDAFAACDDFMPTLDELDGSDKSAMYYHTEALIFESDAYTVSSRFSDDEYESAKRSVEESVPFESKSLGGVVKGVDVRLVSLDLYDCMYPQKMYFVGFDDANKRIVYTAFFDIDLDYIEKFDEFMVEYCGW